MSERPRASRSELAVCLALVAVLTPTLRLQAAEGPTIQAAASAAEAWLALLDAREIERAWAELAPEARACSTGGENAALREILTGYGALERRTLKKSKERKSLDGLPPVKSRKYVELKYKTTFEFGKAEEAVVLLPSAEAWEVRRYCINEDR